MQMYSPSKYFLVLPILLVVRWWSHSTNKMSVTHAFRLYRWNMSRCFLFLLLRTHGFFLLITLPGCIICLTAFPHITELICLSMFYAWCLTCKFLNVGTLRPLLEEPNFTAIGNLL